ncbi:prestin-like [Glandiceps talaboti]
MAVSRAKSSTNYTASNQDNENSRDGDINSNVKTSKLAVDGDDIDMKMNEVENDSVPMRKSYRVERPVYSQDEFHSMYKESPIEYIPYKERIKKKFSKCTCSGHCCKGCVTSGLPILDWLPKYSVSKQLVGDLICGCTVAAMNIPQGMAYALLASVPAVYGLYLSIFGPLFYAFTGTSRQMAVGTFAVVSMMVGSAVEKAVPLEDPSDSSSLNSDNSTSAPGGWDREQELITAAVSLALLVGMIQLTLGLLRLGWITIYFSDPFIRGYTTGAALHVFSSQIDDLLGLDIPSYYGAFNLLYKYRDIVTHMDYCNSVTIMLSICCIIFLIIMKTIEKKNKKRLRGYPLGAELILVIAGALTSWGLSLADYGVDVIGDIPTGLPPPKPPGTTYMSSLISDAIAIAIVSFAVSVAIGSLFAQKRNYKIDPNQELNAYGATNILGSFFSCYPACCSLSRSLVQESSGGSTQLAGIVNSVLILIILVVLAPLFEPLPKCVLAAIIVVALKGMFRQFLDLPKLWKYDFIDFNVWWFTCLAVFLFDVDLGLVIGLAFALFVVVWRTQEPFCTLLGRIPGTDLYQDIHSYSTAKEIPGMKIFHMQGSLYFANTDHFKKRVKKLTKVNPLKILQVRAEFDLQKEKEEQRIKAEMKKNGESIEVQVPNDQIQDDATNTTTNSELRTPMGHVVSDDWTHDGTLTEPHEDDAEFHSARVEQPAFYEDTDDDNSDNQELINNASPHDQPYIHTIIIDCGPFNFIDATGLAGLVQLFNEYKKVGIKLLLAQPKRRVRETLTNGDFYEKVTSLGQKCVFLTVHDAVLHAVDDDNIMDHEIHVSNTDGQIKAHIHNVVEDQIESLTPIPIDVPMKVVAASGPEQDTAF